MDYDQWRRWSCDDVDSSLGISLPYAGRTAHVLVRTRSEDDHSDVEVTVAGNGLRLSLGGFEDEAQARIWAHLVARVAVSDITSSAEAHASPTEVDIAIHRDLAEARDLLGMIRGMWSHVGTADAIIRPTGSEYELILVYRGVYRHAGRLTASRADEVRSAVLELSGAGAGSTNVAFDANGHAVRTSIMTSGSGFLMTLRPIRTSGN